MGRAFQKWQSLDTLSLPLLGSLHHMVYADSVFIIGISLANVVERFAILTEVSRAYVWAGSHPPCRSCPPKRGTQERSLPGQRRYL